MRELRWRVLHLALTLSVIFTSVDARAQARFLPLGDLPGGATLSRGFAVTHDGVEILASGGSATAGGQEIFLWSESLGMESLGDLPGGIVEAEAADMSADGSRIVGFGESTDGQEAFLWIDGVGLTGLGDLPGGAHASRIRAITPDGALLVGQATDADGTFAVRWTEAGGFEKLADPAGGFVKGWAAGVTPDGSVIVGDGSLTGLAGAYRWTAATGMQAIGPAGSRGKSVTDDGTVVVGIAPATGGFQAYRWTETLGLEPLGDLPGGNVFGQANGVSGDGKLIAGFSSTGHPATVLGFEAFLWTERDGMRLFKDVLEQDYGLDLAGFTPWVSGVSSSGHLFVGTGVTALGDEQAFVVELPVTACHNGLDDDGDGLSDLDDPACENLADDTEQDPCQNGVDDDHDGTIDFDGGASIHGSAIADPDAACVEPWTLREGRRCGLGGEAALLLPGLLAWRRHRATRR